MPVVCLDLVAVDLATASLQDEHRQAVTELSAHQRPGLLTLSDRRVHDHLAAVDDHVRDALERPAVDLALQGVDEVLRRIPELPIEVPVLVPPVVDGADADLEAKSDLGDPETLADAIDDGGLVLRNERASASVPGSEVRGQLRGLRHERVL